jgi:hypothetical protein
LETSFFNDLIVKAAEPTVVTATFRVDSDPASLKQPDALLDILGIDEDVLSDTARRTLYAFEDDEERDRYITRWSDFKWKVTAFVQIQDIFDAPIMTGSYLNAFHLWYFYFESKHLLDEAIVCGFNGLYAASNALMRLFMEFNILQSQ